ncbi:MAG TPA: tRNA pseudouridine(55) synthase TruB [Deltaproteobacteria bacterium]|nr:tRNA pseudouridine(55) synthase TruB [Deltaproteobacteria bacterium]
MSISGFLIIDKPAGVTSHDVVAAVRAATGIKKVGHTGTLDPFATGVLPLALGRSTRLIQYLDESIKVYDARIELGTATDTGDLTGEVVRSAPPPEADEAEVARILEGFLGDRMQEPPAYSAVKVAGKPMYKYAREGEVVRAPARKIHLHALELLSYDREHLRVRITCSRGTYARVLADEIAAALGSAGHLGGLCRDRSGPFLIEDAVSMERLASVVSAEEGHPWRAVLMAKRGEPRIQWRPRDEVRADIAPWLWSDLRSLSHLPLADLAAVDVQRVRNGGPPPPPPRGVAMGGRYLVVCGDELVAIAEHSTQGARLLRVL